MHYAPEALILATLQCLGERIRCHSIAASVPDQQPSQDPLGASIGPLLVLRFGGGVEATSRPSHLHAKNACYSQLMRQQCGEKPRQSLT